MGDGSRLSLARSLTRLIIGWCVISIQAKAQFEETDEFLRTISEKITKQTEIRMGGYLHLSIPCRAECDIVRSTSSLISRRG